MSDYIPFNAKVGKRGVVTIPKDVREQYNIEKGDILRINLELPVIKARKESPPKEAS